MDTEKEEIFKASSQEIGASDLESLISKKRAGYHLFKYAHRHNGENLCTTGELIFHSRMQNFINWP